MKQEMKIWSKADGWREQSSEIAGVTQTAVIELRRSLARCMDPQSSYSISSICFHYSSLDGVDLLLSKQCKHLDRERFGEAAPCDKRADSKRASVARVAASFAQVRWSNKRITKHFTMLSYVKRKSLEDNNKDKPHVIIWSTSGTVLSEMIQSLQLMSSHTNLFDLDFAYVKETLTYLTLI